MSLPFVWILFFYAGFLLVWVTHRLLIPAFQWKASISRQVYVIFLGFLFLFPALYLAKPSGAVWSPWKPPVQIYDLGSNKGLQVAVLSRALPAKATSQIVGVTENTLSQMALIFAAAISLGLVFFLLRLRKESGTLSRLARRSGLLKQQGRLKIFLSPEIESPFSVWPARIFLPLGLKRQEQKISLLHEMQHLRQGDLYWTLVQDLIFHIFFFVPGRSQFRRCGEEIFEMACDEALMQRRRLEPHAYGTTLIQFMQKASHLQPVGSAGMAASHQQLKRRLKMIFRNKPPAQNPWISRFATMITITLLTTSALAVSNLVKDHQMNLAQLKALAARTQNKTDVPLVINQEVLASLNLAVGNPRGRFYFRKTLERMKTYEVMIKQQLKQNRLPEVLMAVPMIESGYQNIDGKTSAGIWQIIPDTARALGLVVDDKLDERFNAEKETEAALKYMQKNYSEFRDWHLALLAYNSGEKALREAIDNAGHRNAFQLLREGYLSAENRKYLPNLMAGILIYLNPDLAQEGN